MLWARDVYSQMTNLKIPNGTMIALRLEEPCSKPSILKTSPMNNVIKKNLIKTLWRMTLTTGIFALTLSHHAQAAYPDRPIKLIIPYAAGGPTDVLGRLVAQKMGEILKQTVVVDNRAGASANVGILAVAKSMPDGYTILFGDINLVVNPFLYKNLSFDVQKDFVSVGLVASAPLVLLVNQNAQAKTLAELINQAKTQPGQFNFGSAGAGNTTHLAMELLKSKYGLDIVHVPYKGANPALNDLVAGHVNMMVTGMSGAKSLLESGRLRALAITGEKRASIMPSVPTFEQAGYPLPEMKIGSWWGMVAPTGTPTDALQTLNASLNTSLNSVELKTKLHELNIEALGGSALDLDKWMASEVQTWSNVIKKAAIQAEP
jgi:tripartite-type tricarboxylate transporter receptor subunit TctC